MLNKNLTVNLQSLITKTFHAELDIDTALFVSNLLTECEGKEEQKWILSYSLLRRDVSQSSISIELPFANETLCLQWTELDLTRCFYLIQLFNQAPKHFPDFFRKLCQFADLKEKVGLYKILFFLPNSHKYADMIVEGIRTNATNVFQSIAFHNPYPFFYLNESAWNQMVLKALFLDQPINRIFGLTERSNPELVRMIQDFIKERTVANRPISSQIMQFLEQNDPNFYGMRTNLFVPQHSQSTDRRI